MAPHPGRARVLEADRDGAPLRRICVFCGASPGVDPALRGRSPGASAHGLAGRGIGVVYGGGRVGLMGAVADAALAAGGEVIGVIPQGLVDRELAHPGLTELHVVGTLHERKAAMAELADAFIALPGGLGTLEELAEVASWAQLAAPRQADRPARRRTATGRRCWRWLDHAVDEGFVRPAHRGLFLEATDLDDTAGRFAAWSPPGDRWSEPRA